MNPTCDTPNCETCKKICLPTTLIGERGFYCSSKCLTDGSDSLALGCNASDLHVGVEFSQDEGRTWEVVRTEPTYVSEESTALKFISSPADSTSLSSWTETVMDERDHVILNRTWKG